MTFLVTSVVLQVLNFVSKVIFIAICYQLGKPETEEKITSEETTEDMNMMLQSQRAEDEDFLKCTHVEKKALATNSDISINRSNPADRNTNVFDLSFYRRWTYDSKKLNQSQKSQKMIMLHLVKPVDKNQNLRKTDSEFSRHMLQNQ